MTICSAGFHCPSATQTPFYLGAYARNNKLPYTMNSTLDIQWQPRNDLAIDIGYVNALGRHEIIPIPFNQSRIASPTNPLCGPAAKCPNPSAPLHASPIRTVTPCRLPVALATMLFPKLSAASAWWECDGVQSEGGNVDLRVPYIGYAAESELYKARGVSAYNALQAHVEKRFSHGLQAGVSLYIFALLRRAERPGPVSTMATTRSICAMATARRTSTARMCSTSTITTNSRNSFRRLPGKARWRMAGPFRELITLQSGQPYSVIDYSGAVGSIFYSIIDGITNPIVPLAPGCTPQSAVTGAIGNNPSSPALKASCFTLPLLNPGDLNGGDCSWRHFRNQFHLGAAQHFPAVLAKAGRHVP